MSSDMKSETTNLVANEEAMPDSGCVKAKHTAILSKQRERSLYILQNYFQDNRKQIIRLYYRSMGERKKIIQ